MKYLILIIIANLQFACSHMEAGPQGIKITNMNMKTVKWTPSEFSASDINSSTPLNSQWRGANGALDIMKDLGLSLSGPTATLPTVVKGAGILGTKFRQPIPIKTE